MAKLKVSAIMDSLSKFPKDAEVTVITDDNDNLDEECLSLCVKSKKMKPTFVLIPYDDVDDTFSETVEVGFCDSPECCNGDCMDDCGCEIPTHWDDGDLDALLAEHTDLLNRVNKIEKDLHIKKTQENIEKMLKELQSYLRKTSRSHSRG